MAKKNSDTLFKEYLAELTEINPALKDILADEKVSAKLKDGVLARADYSAKMDEFRATMEAERTAFAAEVTEAREKISGWQKWYGDTSKEVATVQNKLKEYVDTYGELETPGERRRAAQSMGISKEELDAALESRMNQRDLAALKFADDLTDIKIDFMTRFKEKLDTEAVYKLAGAKGVDLSTAYKDYISERVEEVDKKTLEDRIKREREEAVAEFASKHRLPVVPNNSTLVHTLDAKDIPNTSQGRIAAALASLNEKR